VLRAGVEQNVFVVVRREEPDLDPELEAIDALGAQEHVVEKLARVGIEDPQIARTRALGRELDPGAPSLSTAGGAKTAQSRDHVPTRAGTELFLLPGPQAEARRARVLPLLAKDSTRLPDTFQSGPDAVTADEHARRRMFGDSGRCTYSGAQLP
jgi:hypothetical protein